MELIEITEDGSPGSQVGKLPDVANEVMAATAEMYRTAGYRPPWVGFLARPVGSANG